VDVKITETAKNILIDEMKSSEYSSPALRIVFNGFG